MQTPGRRSRRIRYRSGGGEGHWLCPWRSGHVLSSGQAAIQISKDPVGAPIFYRDVPLMPSETEKGVIKPLAASAMQLIQWRLRSIDQPRSRVVLEGMHTCANCHSFSRDGKSMGIDMDGPRTTRVCTPLFQWSRRRWFGPRT